MAVIMLYLTALVVIGILNLFGIETGGNEVFNMTNILIAVIGSEALEQLRKLNKNISKLTEEKIETEEVKEVKEVIEEVEEKEA